MGEMLHLLALRCVKNFSCPNSFNTVVVVLSTCRVHAWRESVRFLTYAS